jgi:hypothetical protein
MLLALEAPPKAEFIVEIIWTMQMSENLTCGYTFFVIELLLRFLALALLCTKGASQVVPWEHENGLGLFLFCTYLEGIEFWVPSSWEELHC